VRVPALAREYAVGSMPLRSSSSQARRIRRAPRVDPSGALAAEVVGVGSPTLRHDELTRTSCRRCERFGCRCHALGEPCVDDGRATRGRSLSRTFMLSSS
jgi:hypothetical protein